MMKRNDAWNTLLNQADKIPDSLDTRIEQAIKRGGGQERKSKMIKPIAALFGTAAAFVLLVNSSVSFALAAGRIPIVQELVEAVAFDPSLKAAVAHEDIQLVGKSYTVDGITLDIEYLMADPKNLSVFYRVKDEKGRYIGLEPIFKDVEGNEIDAHGNYGDEIEQYEEAEEEQEQTGWFDRFRSLFGGENADRTLYVWKFHMDEVPEQLQIEARVFELEDLEEMDEVPLDIGFEVPLTIDPEFLTRVKVLLKDETIEVLGQQLIIDSVEVYPTNTRILWHAAPENNGWFTYLLFYITDDTGERVEAIHHGVFGRGNGMEQTEVWVESAWYDRTPSLTLHLDEAAVLPKDMPPIILYEDGTLAGLPDYMEQRPTDEPNSFEVLTQKGTHPNNPIPLFTFIDADGEEGALSDMSIIQTEEEGVMDMIYTMPIGVKYPLALPVAFAPVQRLEPAVAVQMKESDK